MYKMWCTLCADVPFRTYSLSLFGRLLYMGLLESLTYACLTLYIIMLSVYVSAHIELPHLQVSVS